MEISSTPLWIIAFSILFLDLILIALLFAIFMVIVDIRVMVRTVQRSAERFERAVEHLESEVGELSESAQDTLKVLQDHPLVRFRPESLGLDRLVGKLIFGFLRRPSRRRRKDETAS